MMKLNLQFFAHKKGVGSTKNGRDSESKRLGAKRADGQFVKAGNTDSVERRFIPATTLGSAEMIHYLHWLTVYSDSREKEETESRLPFIR